MTPAMPQDGARHDLGDFPLESGQVLPGAWLVYKTFGQLNAARNNLVVYPTSFGTVHGDLDWLVGPGRGLDTDRWFVVMVNLFGGGLSSSPSLMGGFETDFPRVSMRDNVAAQQRLIRERFDPRRVALAVGFSMGAQAAYHWACDAPDLVARAAVICGSARTSIHNYVFLEGVRAALTGDPAWTGRRFAAPPQAGLRRMGRVYAGWGLAPGFYRRRLFLDLGFADVEDFIVNDWEARFLRKDGNDLLSMIDTWQSADISRAPVFGGDLPAALAAIRARVLLMPSTSDQYFPVADSELELGWLADGMLRPIETDWGHRVNNPRQNPRDARFVEAQLRAFLAE